MKLTTQKLNYIIGIVTRITNANSLSVQKPILLEKLKELKKELSTPESTVSADIKDIVISDINDSPMWTHSKEFERAFNYIKSEFIRLSTPEPSQWRNNEGIAETMRKAGVNIEPSQAEKEMEDTIMGRNVSTSQAKERVRAESLRLSEELRAKITDEELQEITDKVLMERGEHPSQAEQEVTDILKNYKDMSQDKSKYCYHNGTYSLDSDGNCCKCRLPVEQAEPDDKNEYFGPRIGDEGKYFGKPKIDKESLRALSCSCKVPTPLQVVFGIQQCTTCKKVVKPMEQAEPKGEQYLNDKIKQAKKNWKGVDADEFISEVRGNTPTTPEDVVSANDLKELWDKHIIPDDLIDNQDVRRMLYDLRQLMFTRMSQPKTTPEDVGEYFDKNFDTRANMNGHIHKAMSRHGVIEMFARMNQTKTVNKESPINETPEDVEEADDNFVRAYGIDPDTGQPLTPEDVNRRYEAFMSLERSKAEMKWLKENEDLIRDADKQLNQETPEDVVSDEEITDISIKYSILPLKDALRQMSVIMFTRMSQPKATPEDVVSDKEIMMMIQRSVDSFRNDREDHTNPERFVRVANWVRKETFTRMNQNPKTG